MNRQQIHIISIFPEIFANFLSTSLIAKAIDRDLLVVTCVNLRDFASPPHFQVDDTPYGGGAGMVLKAEPLTKAIEDGKRLLPAARVILLSANGSLFTQAKAHSLSQHQQIIFVCGRYEGIDQRAIDLCIDEEISIGDYVLMGGEVAAMVVMEASVRLIDGVLGNPESIRDESFTENAQGVLLEGPQYTRPAEFRGHNVPEPLLSGDHAKIASWRISQSVERTRRYRPTLLLTPDHSPKDS